VIEVNLGVLIDHAAMSSSTRATDREHAAREREAYLLTGAEARVGEERGARSEKRGPTKSSEPSKDVMVSCSTSLPSVSFVERAATSELSTLT